MDNNMFHSLVVALLSNIAGNTARNTFSALAWHISALVFYGRALGVW